MRDSRQETTPDFETLVRRLERSGYRFSGFVQDCEDPCEPVDVEWNYKDMVHVSFVHSHMWREFTLIGENNYTTLDLQRVAGIDIPQSTSFYTTVDGALIAHTTLFLFIVLVEVRFELLGPLRTRTTTRYAVGSKVPLAGLLFPIIRFALKRNWERFTRDDRPLRSRRGALRARGFTFDQTSPINIRETLNITSNHVVPPADPQPDFAHRLKVSDHLNQTVHLGDDDHFGLQLEIGAETLTIFPRLCPHMGSSLDQDRCPGDTVACRWHGRKFRALCVVDLNGGRQAFAGPLHSCVYDGEFLTIAPASGAAEVLAGAPQSGFWTEPWQAEAASAHKDGTTAAS
jgi:hypothetical protein